jgi:hypothetical protein
VPEQLLHLLQVPARHDQPGRAGVPEVVEPKIVEPGHRHGPLEGRSDAAPGCAIFPTEHRPLTLRAGDLDQDALDSLVHRHLAPPAGLGVVEQQDPSGEVDALPGEAEAFPSPAPVLSATTTIR